MIEKNKIDYNKLQRGIYVREKRDVGGSVITMFDIRMKLPNREPAMSQQALHTIEHLGLAFLRNHAEWGNRVIYWGPMGCCTGNHLLLEGDLESRDIAELMRETFGHIAEYEGDIPYATASECANYMLHNLAMAKWESRKYLVEVLNELKEENMSYPLREVEEYEL